MKKIINIQELHPQHQNGELITLKGYTTSRVEQALKGSKTHGQSPYPARVFLKEGNQGTDIPVFFRIKEGES